MILSKVISIGAILFTIFQNGFSLEIPDNDNHLMFTNDTILYVGGDGPGNYTKIQDAIDNASSGDTVYVYNGIYHEGVIINKTITLLGEDKNITIIDSTNISDITVFISKYADGVIVSGFTIKNDEIDPYAISIYPVSDNNIIFNNIMRNRECIIIEEYEGEVSCGNNISNNDIFGWYNGIIIRSSSNNSICRNYISYAEGYSLGFVDSNDNTIIENQLIHNEYGLILSKSSNNVVSRNVIQDCIWSGIMGGSNTDNIICYNIISENGDGGIQLDYVTNYKIYQNRIENNTNIGILLGYSTGNKIYENNIFNNEMDATWQSTLTGFLFLLRNRWYGNYWGAPRALPKPIFGLIYLGSIGNLHLLFPRFQYDLIPAQEPYDISTP